MDEISHSNSCGENLSYLFTFVAKANIETETEKCRKFGFIAFL